MGRPFRRPRHLDGGAGVRRQPLEIDRTLQHALVTDEELADEKSWSDWDDPFGEFHEDPCDESQSPYAETESTREANE